MSQCRERTSAMIKYTPEQRIEKFWSRVDKSGDDNVCWIWLGSKNELGYGTVRWEEKTQLSHRIAYRLAFGDIPVGLKVCHSCDNPSCVNPVHLWLGTDADNAHDRDRKGRANSARGFRAGVHTHPESRARGDKNGMYTHPESRVHHKGEANGMARLTAEQVVEIRRRYKFRGGKESGRQLAVEFGTTYKNISLIVRGKRWKHIL